MEDKIKELEKEYQDAQDEYVKLATRHTLESGIAKAKIESVLSQLEDLRKKEFSELLKSDTYHCRKNAFANEVVCMKILSNNGKELIVDEIAKRYDDFGRLSSYYISRGETKPSFDKYSYENYHWYEITKEEFEKEII